MQRRATGHASGCHEEGKREARSEQEEDKRRARGKARERAREGQEEGAVGRERSIIKAFDNMYVTTMLYINRGMF
jgi:hypothetical protein